MRPLDVDDDDDEITLAEERPSVPPPPSRSSAPPPPSGTALRAKALYETALAEVEALDRVAACRSLKLAMAFDPQNMEVRRLLSELNAELSAASCPKLSRAAAQKAFEEACAAEQKGDVEAAIRGFEIALKHGPEAAAMNRLAILLATRRREVSRAEELLERAIQLAPATKIYVRNLERIRAGLPPAPKTPSVPPRPKKAPRAKRLEARPSLLGGLFGRG
ncbi:MAG: tetratricopeptide repeat protein [Myxococcota bacterium]